MFDKEFKRVNTFEDFRTELVEGKEKRAGTKLIQENAKKQKVKDDKETAELKHCLEIIPDEEEVTIDAIPLAVKQDLEDLYKLVKAKYESTRPVEDLDLLLWGDLKTMFGPHVEDKIYMLVEKKYPLAPLTLSMMLEKKLIIDHEINAASENMFEVTTASEYQVNAAMGSTKNIATSELKKIIEKMKGKTVDTKFDKPSVRQPNALRIPKSSVLGKTTLFSYSLERKSFSKTKAVTKTNVSDGLSKPVTTQILPQIAKQAVRNTNVIKPGMYQIDTRTTQTRVPQLPQTSRNTNPRISTSTGVIHNTSVSRPQLKSTQMKEKVMQESSQVKSKKTKVEDNHRISSISNKIKSATACNDSLKVRTSNVNDVCVTCEKYVFNLNHDACVSKFIYDVNARTKKPKVVPISTRKPKIQANKSVATPHKKIVTSDSTIQGIEFLNKTLHAYFKEEGIEHQTFTPRTPEQNGIVERRNRILVENRSLIIPRHEHRPYHIINGRKPSLKHLHIFGYTCYLTRDGENLDKMKEKGDSCILVGYSTQSKGYKVYNTRTRVIVESIHINFDEIKELSKASDFDNSGPAPQLQKTSDHKCSELGIQDHRNEPSSSMLVPNVSPPSSALFDNSKQQDTQPIENIQPTTEPITPTTNVNAEENNNDQAGDAQIDENEFYNIFSTPVHLEMCMFALTVSTAEPKNIKEAMADSAWIEAMQDELHQFDRLQEEGLDFEESFALVARLKSLPSKESSICIEASFKSLAKYALEILKKHGMERCESLGTPLATKPKLDADLSGTPVDQTKYQSMIGSLMYLTSSRPDIVQAVCYCARYQARPTEKHLKEVKRIFRYLKGTINMGLWYPKDSGFELTAFSDADHVGCIDTRKSTSGGIQFLGDKLVSWMSKKQDCTAMSSAEAEYVALSASCAQVMWMRTQLKDYGFDYNKIPLYCDSQSAIAISCNPVQHSRTKHIHTRYHFIKEQVERGIIELYFVRTEYQLADMFMKVLPQDWFEYLVRRIGMRCLTPAELEVGPHGTGGENDGVAASLQLSQIHYHMLILKLQRHTISIKIQESRELNTKTPANYDIQDLPKDIKIIKTKIVKGDLFLLGGGAVSWASKKQTCIISSTMKYEFVALAAVGKEAKWLKNLILEIPLWSKPIALISIRCDSVATLAKAYSQMYSGNSRHLGVRHNIIRELIMNVVVSIEYVRSQQNLVDQLMEGGLTNGYQESTTIYSASSVGYSLISSIGAQRMASQMIPTPGLNNNNNGNSSSNQSYMNMVVSGIGEHTNQQWE
ncbi:retrovirus-related pol polyprotein from transposon TNT 1-94 [Tanacetum coccineum]